MSGLYYLVMISFGGNDTFLLITDCYIGSSDLFFLRNEIASMRENYKKWKFKNQIKLKDVEMLIKPLILIINFRYKKKL